MAIQCDWLVLCQRVVEDSVTKNLSLLNCLESVTVHDFPCYFPGFAFAANFSRTTPSPADVGSWEFRLTRASKTAPERVVVTASAECKPNTERLRVFINFAVLALQEPGPLFFRIDWRKVGRNKWHQGQQVSLNVDHTKLSTEEQNSLRELNINYVPDV